MPLTALLTIQSRLAIERATIYAHNGHRTVRFHLPAPAAQSAVPDFLISMALGVNL
jgi:hypothetical protein